MRLISRSTVSCHCFAIALALGLLVSGCSSDDTQANPGANDIFEMELFESTLVLDDEATASLSREDPDGTLHFSNSPAALAQVQRGSVVIGKPSRINPAGMLRLVTSVERQGSELVLTNLPTLPQLAFRRLRIQATRTIEPDLEHPELRPLATGAAFPGAMLDEFLFNGDDDATTTDDQVHVGGNLAAGISYTFGLSSDWSDVTGSLEEATKCALSLFLDCDPLEVLPEITGGFSFEAGAAAKLQLSGTAFLDYERSIALPKVTFEPIFFGPLAFFPELEVRADIEGEASSLFELGSTVSAHVAGGLTYSSRSGGSVKSPQFDTPKFEVLAAKPALGARSRVRVGPRLSVKLYKMLGPFASIYAFAELDADRNRTPCYELTAGLEGDIGMTLAIEEGGLRLGLPPISKDFGIASSVIDQGVCPLPPSGVSENALEALANPSFTPWANTYGEVLLHFPSEDAGAQVEWTNVTPTVDGSWIVAGSAMETLLKIKRDGTPLWTHTYSLPLAWNDTLSQPELLPDRVVATPDAGLIVSAFPYVLMKLNAQGGIDWANQFAWPYRETMLRTTGVISSADGSYWVVGNRADTRTATFEQIDPFVARIDAMGAIRWAAGFGAPALGEIVRTVVPYAGGSVIVGSTWDPNGAFWRGWLVRLGPNNEVIWARELQATADEQSLRTHLTSGFETTDGDLIAAGTVDVGSRMHLLITKFKADGTLAWSSAADAPDSYIGVELSAVAPLATSGMVAAGRFSLRNASDFWFAGLDSIGRVQWMKRLGRTGGGGPLGTDPGDHNAPGLAVTADGGLLLAGYTEGLATGTSTEGVAILQAYAKDGTLSLADLAATISTASTAARSVAVTSVAWAPNLTNLEIPAGSVDVTVTKRVTPLVRLAP